MTVIVWRPNWGSGWSPGAVSCIPIRRPFAATDWFDWLRRGPNPPQFLYRYQAGGEGSGMAVVAGRPIDTRVGGRLLGNPPPAA